MRTLRRLGTLIRERILETRIGARPLRTIVYPPYVRVYPLLFFMRHFDFEGQRYRYMFHPYGTTLRGERIVEVPIALRALTLHGRQRILEVGNVLRHYVECDHDVVDKYEQGPGCINEDIIEFQPKQPYDFILSISTVEHIGWNEYERVPDQAVQALHHMKNLLAPGGSMLVTIPWGSHPVLDSYLQSQHCLFTKLRYMKRTSWRNTWAQVEAGACRQAKYGEPYPFANVLILAYLTTP